MHTKADSNKVESNNSSLQNDTITSIEQLKTYFNKKKPPLTINCLIFMAIEDSANKCLPVRDIYDWIETSFPCYQTLTNGWKSSIRHNLSFSKCFSKMDRLESCKYLRLSNTMASGVSKQRLSPAFGTCWKVNAECRDYLIHALKKSSFWLKYSRFYPNLVDLVHSSHYDHQANAVFDHQTCHIHRHPSIRTQHKKFRKHTNKHDTMEEDVTSTNSLSWLMNTSSSLSLAHLTDNDNTDDADETDACGVDDVTKAAEILVSNKLTNLTKQLHNKTFSQLNLKNATTNILNSDLEIEVASTLVRMKSLIETRT
jgi:hypothetical protein